MLLLFLLMAGRGVGVRNPSHTQMSVHQCSAHRRLRDTPDYPPGTRIITNSAATAAFGRPTSFNLQRASGVHAQVVLCCVVMRCRRGALKHTRRRAYEPLPPPPAADTV